MIPGVKKRSFTLHEVMVYFSILRSYFRLMALLMCLSLACGAAFYTYVRPVYASRSLVQIDIVNLPMDADKVYRDSRLSQVIRGINSAPVLERTMRRLGVKASAQAIRREHIKKLVLRVNSERDLEIGFYPFNKRWAEVFPKMLIEEYLRFREEKRIELFETTMKAFTREMEEMSQRMDEKTDRKFDFINEREMTEAEIALRKVQSIPKEVVRLQQKIDEADSVRRRLDSEELDVVSKLSLISAAREQMLSVGDVLSQAETVQEHDFNPDSAPKEDTATIDGSGNQQNAAPGVVVVPSMVQTERSWQTAEREVRQLEAEVRKASITYLPGHKIMRDLEKKLTEAQQVLDVEYSGEKARFDLEYDQMKVRLADLEKQLPDFNEAKKSFYQLKRDYSINSSGDLAWGSFYQRMAKRLNTLDFAQDRERVTLQYIGLLELHEKPISPNRSKLFIMCLIVGAAAAIGVPFLMEYLDHTVSNIEEVESTFHIRGLGVVPQVGDEEMQPPALVDTEDGQQTHLVENFRVIRTNLLSMGAATKQPQVVMVTSSMPREGKTVVSSNLAYSFVRAGAKTILIDTDLRRGRLHRLFGYRKTPGLSEYLLGDVQLDQACRASGMDGLHVITAGKHLDSGTELLGSERFAALLQELRGKYDRIILDTPPVLGLSETSVMQSVVDGVLFVIWSGKTPMKNIKVALEVLQSNGANFYGFILNRLDLSATKNYYQYYYYSNDYYYNYHAIENA